MSSEQDPALTIDTLVLEGLYHSEVPPTHETKWKELGENAAFAREALVRAQRIREEGVDAGNAYLEGIADFHAAVVRQALLQVVQTFNPEEELQQIEDTV